MTLKRNCVMNHDSRLKKAHPENQIIPLGLDHRTHPMSTWGFLTLMNLMTLTMLQLTLKTFALQVQTAVFVLNVVVLMTNLLWIPRAILCTTVRCIPLNLTALLRWILHTIPTYVYARTAQGNLLDTLIDTVFRGDRVPR